MTTRPPDPDRAIAEWAQAFLPIEQVPLPPQGAIDRLSPTNLAYLGDAVYELHTRLRYLFPPQRIATYHRAVVAEVRAGQRAAYLEQWQPHLSSAEQDIVRRGRNATTRRPARLDAKIYQQASGFETLIGYLYLADPERLRALLALLPTA
jgi:ribonuclease-3 family protein